jgi:hypothetical protein
LTRSEIVPAGKAKRKNGRDALVAVRDKRNGRDTQRIHKPRRGRVVGGDAADREKSSDPEPKKDPILEC